MSYKTILVCLTTEENAERLTRAACSLARKFGSHIIGLHTLQSLRVYPGVSLYLTPEATKAFRDAQTRQAERIQDIFQQEMGRHDMTGAWKLVNADADSASVRQIEYSHQADLVVMSQADPDTDRPDQVDIQREVIMGSGCPVIVVPNAGTFEDFGNKIMIGWSATREAARAVHDALPFLDGGEATLMWVADSDTTAKQLGDSAEAAAANLQRHGCQTSVTHWQNTNLAIGDALLNEAFESGCDMIVSGAFGHSRFYDFVIGATTTHLLRHMTMPVLFSH